MSLYNGYFAQGFMLDPSGQGLLQSILVAVIIIYAIYKFAKAISKLMKNVDTSTETEKINTRCPKTYFGKVRQYYMKFDNKGLSQELPGSTKDGIDAGSIEDAVKKAERMFNSPESSKDIRDMVANELEKTTITIIMIEGEVVPGKEWVEKSTGCPCKERILKYSVTTWQATFESKEAGGLKLILGDDPTVETGLEKNLDPAKYPAPK